ncbi:MAG: hypothetical protein WEC33_03135 [Dehalococcoidia bacterium]
MGLFERWFHKGSESALAEPPEELLELGITSAGEVDARPPEAEVPPPGSVLSKDDMAHAREVMEKELAGQRRAMEAERRDELAHRN